jgi:hypothetical protein
MKMGAIYSSETLASACIFTRRCTPEDEDRHLHCRENLKSHKGISFLSDLPFFVSSFYPSARLETLGTHGVEEEHEGSVIETLRTTNKRRERKSNMQMV